MVATYYEDEDPINIVEDEEYEDPEEKAELIRMIYLAQCMRLFGEIDVRHNKQFTRHLKVTQFIKYVGEYLITKGFKKNMIPSFLKKIRC